MCGQNESSELKAWLDHITTYRIPVLRYVQKQINFRGDILEIGSGTSWLSLELSKLPEVKSITAIDSNPDRLAVSKNYFAQQLQGNVKKINFVEGDFDDLTHYAALIRKRFDYIVCEAALHHTDNLPQLLHQLSLHLLPGGQLIAIREPILPLLKQYRKYNFGVRQIANGDTEMIYTKAEWKTYFKNAGFKLVTQSVFIKTTRKEKFLYYMRKFNFILFNRSVFIATKI